MSQNIENELVSGVWRASAQVLNALKIINISISIIGEIIDKTRFGNWNLKYRKVEKMTYKV